MLAILERFKKYLLMHLAKGCGLKRCRASADIVATMLSHLYM